MSVDPKQALKDQLVSALTAGLDAARHAYRSALEGATHEQAQAENDKDTRGLEQSYLARGQAMRVEEGEVQLAAVEAMMMRSFPHGAPVALSALVTVEEDDRSHRFFIAPHGGGVVVDDAIHVVTPGSPLGRALLGKRVDDECEIRLPGRVRQLVVLAIE